MPPVIPERAKHVVRKAGGVSPLLQLRALMERRAQHRAAEARVQAQRRAQLHARIIAEQREAQNRGINVIDDDTDEE